MLAPIPLCAVDHEGEVLESYVTKFRDKAAALAFLKKAMKRHDRAETIVPDGLRSYPAAMRQLGNLPARDQTFHTPRCSPHRERHRIGPIGSTPAQLRQGSNPCYIP